VRHKEQSEKYKKAALELLKKYSSGNQLQADKVLESIPEDWDISSSEYNLLSYFTNMFDHMLTVEENTKISSYLSNMECLNKEKEAN